MMVPNPGWVLKNVLLDHDYQRAMLRLYYASNPEQVPDIFDAPDFDEAYAALVEVMARKTYKLYGHFWPTSEDVFVDQFRAWLELPKNSGIESMMSTMPWMQAFWPGSR